MSVDTEATWAIGEKTPEDRLGAELYARRLAMQEALRAKRSGQGRGLFRFEHRFPMHGLLRMGLRCLGGERVGARNFIDVRVVENELPVRGLPMAFDGFRMLHLADLHIDLAPEILVPAITAKLAGLDYDVCVNTGDFRSSNYECHGAAMRETAKIYRAVRGPAVTVFGNHDFIEKTPELEAMGVRVLLNEAVRLERDGESLWLAGVDDPHYYQTDDLPRALQGVPAGATVVLLAHSPAYGDVAAASGRVAAMLCGHTHGGQICLPGGKALVTHCHCPRERVRGAWSVGGMSGYTCPGAGGSALPARFNCPPEITVHVLRCAGTP